MSEGLGGVGGAQWVPQKEAEVAEQLNRYEREKTNYENKNWLKQFLSAKPLLVLEDVKENGKVVGKQLVCRTPAWFERFGAWGSEKSAKLPDIVKFLDETFHTTVFKKDAYEQFDVKDKVTSYLDKKIVASREGTFGKKELKEAAKLIASFNLQSLGNVQDTILQLFQQAVQQKEWETAEKLVEKLSPEKRIQVSKEILNLFDQAVARRSMESAKNIFKQLLPNDKLAVYTKSAENREIFKDEMFQTFSAAIEHELFFIHMVQPYDATNRALFESWKSEMSKHDNVAELRVQAWKKAIGCSQDAKDVGIYDDIVAALIKQPSYKMSNKAHALELCKYAAQADATDKNRRLLGTIANSLVWDTPNFIALLSHLSDTSLGKEEKQTIVNGLKAILSNMQENDRYQFKDRLSLNEDLRKGVQAFVKALQEVDSDNYLIRMYEPLSRSK